MTMHVSEAIAKNSLRPRPRSARGRGTTEKLSCISALLFPFEPSIVFTEHAPLALTATCHGGSCGLVFHLQRGFFRSPTSKGRYVVLSLQHQQHSHHMSLTSFQLVRSR